MKEIHDVLEILILVAQLVLSTLRLRGGEKDEAPAQIAQELSQKTLTILSGIRGRGQSVRLSCIVPPEDAANQEDAKHGRRSQLLAC